MRWGLIPSWAKDSSAAARMINAKSETAGEKPAFRDALKSRRCMIPADAFYEWSRAGKTKQPYCFEVNEGELFAFAGLWDRWKDASGNTVETCSILTTTPNAVTSAVHDRMPVIIDPDSYDLWLDPGMAKVEAVSDLLRPCDARMMRRFPISTRINHVMNDDEECSRPVDLAPTRIGYSLSTMTNDERMQRESNLIATVRKKLPEFAKACADDMELVLLHQGGLCRRLPRGRIRAPRYGDQIRRSPWERTTEVLRADRNCEPGR
jgi:putative SOS response-associated peptidase YedK